MTVTDLSSVRGPVETANGLPNAHYVDPVIFEEEKHALLYSQWAGLAVGADATLLMCPSSIRTHSPVSRSHTRSVFSPSPKKKPVATRRPLGETAAVHRDVSSPKPSRRQMWSYC